MRKLISVISAVALVASPALAADNFVVKDATGTTITKASKDFTGVQADKNVCVTLADSTIDCFLELNAAIRAEDTASASADSGIPIFAVRAASPANTSGTDGDYEPLQIANGALWVKDNAANTVLGAVGDSAWASGSGSAIALLKTIATASLDTTALNTSPHKTSTPVRIVSAAASTNLTEIADSGGCTVGAITGSTARTTPVYAKFYNAADGSVTVGTTTPYLTIALPAGGTQPTAFQIDVNQKFASGACSIAFTTAVADNSTAALTAADLLAVNITWNP